MEIQKFKNLEIFENEKHRCSLKKASEDSDGKNPGYMTESEMEVINFDKVKDSYIRGMKLSKTPCSNDALYFAENGKIYFIEFKNGFMTPKKVYEVYNKIYDSLLIFNDIVGKTISFCRENVYFILVYNESNNHGKNGDEEQDASKKDEAEKQDSAKSQIAKHIHKKAKRKFERFGLKRFEKIYFKEVYAYTEMEFKEFFIEKIERNENS